jgi:hypothetical protein
MAKLPMGHAGDGEGEDGGEGGGNPDDPNNVPPSPGNSATR